MFLLRSVPVAHNTSREKRRRTILAFPLDILGDWHLHADCRQAGCPRGRLLPLAEVGRRRPTLTVGDLLLRMKCGRCGQPPRRAALLRRNPEGRGLIVEEVA